MIRTHFSRHQLASMWSNRIIIIIKHKGEAYKINEDSAEKRLFVDLWVKNSQENCLFLMAVKRDESGQGIHQKILNAIG